MKKGKFLTMTSASALAVIVALMFPMTAFAADAATLTSTINNWNSGGTGSLTATRSGNNVTVTGTVSNATAGLAINMDSDVTVIWRASVSRTAGVFSIDGHGTFILESGTISVTSGGNTAIIISNHLDSRPTVIMSGGTVIKNTNGHVISVFRGTFIMTGGTVEHTVNFAANYGISVSNYGSAAILGGTIKMAHTSNTAFYIDNAGTTAAIGYSPSVSLTGGTAISASAQGGIIIRSSLTAALQQENIGTDNYTAVMNHTTPPVTRAWVNNGGSADILVTFDGGATNTIPMRHQIAGVTPQTITPSTYSNNTPVVGSVINSTDGTYTPNQGGAAGAHVYQWKRSDNADRTGNVTNIAATRNYTVLSADFGKYIWIETTPVGEAGLPGVPVQGQTIRVGVSLTVNVIGGSGGTNIHIGATQTNTQIVYGQTSVSFTRTSSTDAVQWTANPAAGTFSAPTSVTTNYTPPANPATGTIALTATLTPPSTIAITSTGLTAGLKVGQVVSGSIIYTLTHRTYAATITPANFVVSNLPPGLSAGTAVRTDNNVVTVPITGTPTTHNASTSPITLPSTIPMANITGATAAVTPTGTVTASAVAMGDGAAIANVPTVSGTPTHNSITVNPATLATPTGQTIQYAINQSGTSTPASGWGTATTFSDLAPSTTHYVWARAQSNTNYSVGTARASAGITTTAAPVPPTITSANNTSIVAGTGGAFQVSATGHPPPTFSLSGTIPSGVSINSTTGLITITSATPMGTYNFTVTANNGISPNATQSFTLTVTSVPVFALTVTAGAGGTLSGTVSGNYEAGHPVSVTAIPDNGYQFVDWTVTGATITGGNTANPAIFNMPAGAVTLTANFVVDDFIVPPTGLADMTSAATWMWVFIVMSLGLWGYVGYTYTSRGKR